VKKPHDCPAFGTLCTPEHPLGATMVSAEGAAPPTTPTDAIFKSRPPPRTAKLYSQRRISL
jgi:hypothetical protein